ncbi:uncharacterized protein PG986_012627 [Apiospora aurea]|uniref:Uncharacterized protein n=1 Tax=Apiospora aurea TaxID=335848 RepID=A0ABR1Q0J0_9PEZI
MNGINSAGVYRDLFDSFTKEHDFSALRTMDALPCVSSQNCRCTSDILQLHFSQRLSVILLLFLPALYGGIHLSAWNYMFGTAAETVM